MNTRSAFTKRVSCRAYQAEQITDRELDILLQAANAAPVGMGNFDTVQLTVVQNRELLDKLDAKGAEFFGDMKLHPLYGAPTMILVSGIADDVELSMCNASCIIENMAVAAADIGLGACYIRGNIRAIRGQEEFYRALNIPEGFMPCGALITGYPKEPTEARELVTDKFAVTFVK